MVDPQKIQKIFFLDAVQGNTFHFAQDSKTQRHKFYISLYHTSLDDALRIISDIKKKPKNNGISDEDFEGYLAGLEDYGPGGSFVPIPLNLDDFIPFTESGNCLSEDVKVIEPREYIYMLFCVV